MKLPPNFHFPTKIPHTISCGINNIDNHFSKVYLKTYYLILHLHAQNFFGYAAYYESAYGP